MRTRGSWFLGAVLFAGAGACACELSACASFGDGSTAIDAGADSPGPTPTDASDPRSRPDGLAPQPPSDAGDAGACADVDLSTDSNNCGVCGRQCGPLSAPCQNGECEHLVFVLSTPTTAKLVGLQGADHLCTTRADVSGSSRGRAPFKAWLSTMTVSAASRLVHAKRRYFDHTGTTVAANWDDLVSGNLAQGIAVTEVGTMVVAHVRTGTTFDGLYDGPSDCSGWTAESPLASNAYGSAGATDTNWTGTSSEPCSVMQNLYCIEQ